MSGVLQNVEQPRVQGRGEPSDVLEKHGSAGRLAERVRVVTEQA